MDLERLVEKADRAKIVLLGLRVSAFARDVAGGAVLELLVQPRSSRSRVVGEHDGRLSIQLAAPPVDGEANAALLVFAGRSP